MEYEQFVNFVNVEGVRSVTTDTRSGSNNLMVEVATSTGVTTILVMHPAIFNEMDALVKEHVTEQLFNNEELFNYIHGIDPTIEENGNEG